MYPIRVASKLLGVHSSTLRRWEAEGKIVPERTQSGQRRYSIRQLQDLLAGSQTQVGRYICYARVSSAKQQSNLANQIEYLRKVFPTYEIVTDVASSLNFDRPGLRSILDGILRYSVRRVVVAHKDRLARIGFDLLELLIQMQGGEIVVLDNKELSSEEELVEDLIEITTVFSARMHGLRRYIPKRDEIKNDTNEGASSVPEDTEDVDEHLENDIQRVSLATEPDVANAKDKVQHT